ncbi:MAG: ATP-binding cassette domain-containing protein, partial [Deltaproteobacteria bacterium]|nr:ATP-binding cassette domain-containing protein [Deltaproteobacteria bacterium]
MKNAIKANGLSYAYGRTEVLKQVCFSVEQGDFFTIIGPNGSGKTTLMKLLS